MDHAKINRKDASHAGESDARNLLGWAKKTLGEAEIQDGRITGIGHVFPGTCLYRTVCTTTRSI